MQAQKPIPVTEPNLHDSLHELTIAIREFFKTYVHRLADIERAHENHIKKVQAELAGAKSVRDRAQESHRQTRSDANSRAASLREKAYHKAISELDNAQRSSGTIRNNLSKMASWAEQHMIKQGVDPDVIKLGLSSRRIAHSSHPLDEATRHHEKAEQILKDLSEIKTAEKIVWPNSNFLGWVILGGSLLIGWLVGSVIGLGFGAGLFFFGLCYVGIIAYMRLNAANNLKGGFDSWIEVKSVIERHIDQYEAEVKSRFDKEKSLIENEQETTAKESQKAFDVQMSAASATFRESDLKCQREFSEAQGQREHALDATRIWLASEANTFHDRAATFEMTTGFAGADWTNMSWDGWVPPVGPASITRFGRLSLGVKPPQHIFPNIKLDFSLPAVATFAGGRCLLFKATGAGKELAVKTVQSIALRLLATVPPGKVRFTLLDPVGLGQNVAAFMPLGDYDDSLIQSRAWTEPQHIDEQLAKVTEHMETVIQKYLRSDYATIEDYNKQAGEVAEPYRVLIVLDFPVNFSETAARRLVSIARNGPRCGVYTIVVQDSAKKLPYQFNVADLDQTATVIKSDEKLSAFSWIEKDLDKCHLLLDEAPPPDVVKRIIKEVGSRAIDAMKVQVPYEKLLDLGGLSGSEQWKGNTEKRIHVPLGPTGARKLQYLTLGEGTAHHAIIIGRTGSGKSNLMHVIITTLALYYAPDELQLYLIDFKQGVEFKPYAEALLPHAQVIAIESEREFGLSVLSGLNDKLHERGEKFRHLGVNSISEYRQKTGEKMPRILLLVDEFQEFFTQEDNISRQATMILDRLVRQGRYAGIHVMLGSQNLASSRSIPTSTINQMGIRIALQSSDADARQVLADDNPAARLLSRPGEAIFNSASGLVEGNNFFQVALFTDEDRQKQLEAVTRLAQSHNSKLIPTIFEGNEPARLEKCRPLNQLLTPADWPAGSKSAAIWIGDPIAIKEATSIRLRRQGGSNFLVVTRNEEEGVGIIAAAVLGLAAQHAPDAAHFFNVDLTTAESSWEEVAEDMARLLPHSYDVYGRRDVPLLLNDLAQMTKARIESQSANEPSVFLIFQGIQRARDLRLEEAGSGIGFSGVDENQGPNARQLLATLLRDGPEVGIHILAWCDSYANLRNVMDPRLLGEFGYRVAGAMSNEDSMHLIDDAAAAKLDKPHRAIFYEEERPGYLEKFRPYAIPDAAWLRTTAENLHNRLRKARSA